MLQKIYQSPNYSYSVNSSESCIVFHFYTSNHNLNVLPDFPLVNCFKMLYKISMPNRVVHFEIEAKDPDKLSKFYSSAFGWKMDKQGDDMGGYIVATTGPQGLPTDIKDIGI